MQGFSRTTSASAREDGMMMMHHWPHVTLSDRGGTMYSPSPFIFGLWRDRTYLSIGRDGGRRVISWEVLAWCPSRSASRSSSKNMQSDRSRQLFWSVLSESTRDSSPAGATREKRQRVGGLAAVKKPVRTPSDLCALKGSISKRKAGNHRHRADCG